MVAVSVFKVNAAVIVVLSLLLVACGKGKGTIVGEWEGTEPNAIDSGTLNLTMKFNGDGSYSMITGTGKLSSEADGTYTYDEAAKQLTLKATKIILMGRETPKPSNRAPLLIAVTMSGNDMTLALPMGTATLTKK